MYGKRGEMNVTSAYLTGMLFLTLICLGLFALGIGSANLPHSRFAKEGVAVAQYLHLPAQSLGANNRMCYAEKKPVTRS